MIEKPWRTGDVPLPVIANRVVHPSYLSLEWALQYYDMIPEHVPNPTSVTTGRGITFTIQHILLIYYHIQPSFFKGYRQEKIDGHKMNIAYPEKALLDKIYLFLHRNPFSVRWLEELRLQNLEEFNIDRFELFSRGANWRKFTEAVEQTCRYIKEAKGEEQ
jgi:predicted transcriptional regulator of viral defense system